MGWKLKTRKKRMFHVRLARISIELVGCSSIRSGGQPQQTELAGKNERPGSILSVPLIFRRSRKYLKTRDFGVGVPDIAG
jgi:hypothetical protein